MPKITLQALLDAGLSEEAAKVVIDLQGKPKEERPLWFRAKITQAQADEITAAFPEVVFSRPIWKLKEKSK